MLNTFNLYTKDHILGKLATVWDLCFLLDDRFTFIFHYVEIAGKAFKDAENYLFSNQKYLL